METLSALLCHHQLGVKNPVGRLMSAIHCQLSVEEYGRVLHCHTPPLSAGTSAQWGRVTHLCLCCVCLLATLHQTFPDDFAQTPQRAQWATQEPVSNVCLSESGRCLRSPVAFLLFHLYSCLPALAATTETSLSELISVHHENLFVLLTRM